VLVEAKREILIPDEQSELAALNGLAALKKVRYVNSLAEYLFTADKGKFDINKQKVLYLYK
jgi:hypothetical protein